MVATLLGRTAFDSFANNSWWIQTVQSSDVSSLRLGHRRAAHHDRHRAGHASAGRRLDARYGDTSGCGAYPRLMAGSVVPIVIGYAIAHYFTLLLVEGQRTAINWSDPLGLGWNVFGSAEMGVNPQSSTTQRDRGDPGDRHRRWPHGRDRLAHEKAVGPLPQDRALRGQLPMLAVMVGYTCAGLVLLFSP